MSSESHKDSDFTLRTRPADVSLSSWPLLDQPLRSWLTLLGTVVVAMLAGKVAHSTAMGLVALLVLNLAFWRLWVPVRFELNRKGIAQTAFKRCRLISWSAIGRYEVYARGVLLLPTSEGSPLAVMRGLFLPCGSRRDDVLALIEYYLSGRLAASDSSATVQGGSSVTGHKRPR